MRLPLFRAALVGAVLALPAVAAAQHSAGVGGWMPGVLVGVPAIAGDAEPELFTLGATATRMRPRRPGLDAAIGVLPRALVDRALAAGARVGLAVPFEVARGGWALPSAGASGVGVVGGDFAAFTPGAYVGAAAAFLGGSAAGVRVGATWHRVRDARAGVWLLEVGVVRNPFARRGG